MSFKSKVFATAAMAISTAAISLVAMNAHAEAVEPVTVTVAIDAYDLSKAQGAEAVYTRLRGAARQACRTLEGRELHLKKAHRECVNEALDDAVASVDNARLTALHQSESAVRIASSRTATRS